MGVEDLSGLLEALAPSPVCRGWRTGPHCQPQLCRFEASLGYMRAYLQKRKMEPWTNFRIYECLFVILSCLTSCVAQVDLELPATLLKYWR